MEDQMCFLSAPSLVPQKQPFSELRSWKEARAQRCLENQTQTHTWGHVSHFTVVYKEFNILIDVAHFQTSADFFIFLQKKKKEDLFLPIIGSGQQQTQTENNGLTLHLQVF